MNTLRLFVALVIVFAALPACGAEPAVFWHEEFDSPTAPVDGKVFYEDKGSGKSGDDVMVNAVADGAIHLALKFDPARRQDRLSMLFGKLEWWPGTETNWGPVDLTKYPIVEFKWRGSGLYFYYDVASASGVISKAYAWPNTIRKERDAAGNEWNISTFRPAPDSMAPTAYTAVKLNGLTFCLDSPAKAGDSDVYIDYIRVRSFTDEEQKLEAVFARTFRNFPKPKWSGFDTFFPFGFFVGYLGSDFEYWDGGFEGVYGEMVRNHLNYCSGTDEIELGRFGSGEPAVDAYMKAMEGLIGAAKSTGIKIGADVRRLMQGRTVNDGYEQLLPTTKKLAQAFPGDTVVSWYTFDEPAVDSLIPIGMSIRAIRESDPLHRPELVVFNNSDASKPYSGFLSLNFWDNYPVLEGSRNPWGIRELAKAYRDVMPGKPNWAVLQAFETRPPAPKGSYVRPSDAEMRLMSYQAISEGTKGLIWYIQWDGGGRDESYQSRTGQGRGGMLATLKDLAKRLVPVGTQLLLTEPADDVKLNVTQSDKGDRDHGVVVSVLRHRSRPVYYLVAANEDLGATRGASVGIPELLLKPGVGAYDLYDPASSNLLQTGTLNVSPLAGGDGRIYIVASKAEYQSARTKLACDTALEDARSLTPDLTIASRWGLPVGAVTAAIEACRAKASKGDAKEAARLAVSAQALLRKVMADSSEFNAVRRALSDMSIEITGISRFTEYASQTPRWWTGRDHPMLVPNPAILDISKRYWEVGRSYRSLKTDFIAGKRDGLWPRLAKARLDCLKMREDALTAVRVKLAPATEPEIAR